MLVKKMNLVRQALFCAAFALSAYAQRHADPFIGTGGHGHTYPGAALPFGMVQLSPDNEHPNSGMSGWDWCSGYNYASNIITGFSHTHLSGTGIGDLCDILLAPRPYRLADDAFVGKKIQDSALLFDHADEVAKPGYYSVKFSKDGIQAEMTVTERVGMHKYRFPADKPASLVLDLGYAINWDKAVDTHVKQTGPALFAGHRHSKGWAADQKLFFVMYLDRKPDEVRYIKADQLIQNTQDGAQGDNIRLILTFQRGGQVQVKVGLSSVDELGAFNNVQKELPHWNFDKVRKQAASAWNQLLNRVQAAHNNTSDAQVFDTALYHAFLAPNAFSDADGRYRGIDGNIHSANGYTYSSTFSLWDTFRASHSLFTLLTPERVDGYVKTMLAFQKQKGQLPNWALWNNESHCMIGYHAVPVLVEAYLKGLTTADGQEILDACIAMADRDVEGIKSYRELGFVDAETENESCARTLEYAYDDSCIARLAEKLGNADVADRFRKRALNFRNVFDAQTGFMRGKKADGSWAEPFDPIASDHRKSPYCEGNAWQWTWSVPHHPAELVNLFGGRENFAAKLDTLFDMPSELSGEAVSPDISGMIGQLAQGNEPSHHIAYMYAWVGQPWKTQARARQIMEQLYKPGPEGLCGNDDCGQMSAWYVFSALGFYPVDPASGIYVLGSPRVKSAKLNFPDGKTFTIQANNQSPQNIYVQSVTLNGKPLNRAYIRHQEIIGGGKLVFNMGPEINTDLGEMEAPPWF
ncbi:MAG: GH92 family glycosyl hydrolase [Holophagales bacterium]|jgi:predicted alpha-1,2-mannosidase|nr:GH92 family glycosyl hydrolase [Holophagales bacterium]